MEEKIKQQLFRIFSGLSESNVLSLATSLLDQSGLDRNAQHKLLQEVMQEAGKQEMVARSVYRWADRALLDKRKPVPL
ncbi:MAG: hypothetical protein Q8R30_03335 [bacterium]|nr:hypothetical protein [bacterium]